MIVLSITAAAGWALAAFLCGLLLGRPRAGASSPRAQTPPAEKQPGAPGAGQGDGGPPAAKYRDQTAGGDADPLAQRRALLEWRNFLRYDGSVQDRAD